MVDDVELAMACPTPSILCQPLGCWHLIEGALVTRLPTRGGDAFLIMRRESRNFTPDDVRFDELMYPHLAGALAARTSDATVEVDFTDQTVTLSTSAQAWLRDEVDLAEPQMHNLVYQAALRFYPPIHAGRAMPLIGQLQIEFSALSKAVMRGYIHDASRVCDDDAAITPAEHLLTPRQREVARLAARGDTVADIALTLSLSKITVRTHIKAIYRRLGVANRGELAVLLS